MKELFDLPLRKVIELAASREPTPGGGSISAFAIANFFYPQTIRRNGKMKEAV